MKKPSFCISLIVLIVTSISLPSIVSCQSTSMSIGPTSIEAPLEDMELYDVIFSVNISFNDISDLKTWTFDIYYDGTMVEYTTYHYGSPYGSWEYIGGWRIDGYGYKGHYTISGELSDENEISGSGTFLTLMFKAIENGSSQIYLDIESIYLEDKFGSPISFIVSNNAVAVEIISFETWTDGEYNELLETYNLLLDDFQTLNATYQSLLVDYSSIEDDYNELNDDYQNLIQDYEDLLADFVALNCSYIEVLSNFNSLEDDYTLLQTEKSQLIEDHESLQSSYTTLSSEYNEVSEKMLTKDNEVNTIIVIMIAFIISTLILAVLTIYLLKKGSFQK